MTKIVFLTVKHKLWFMCLLVVTGGVYSLYTGKFSVLWKTLQFIHYTEKSLLSWMKYYHTAHLPLKLD